MIKVFDAHDELSMEFSAQEKLDYSCLVLWPNKKAVGFDASVTQTMIVLTFP